MDCIFCKIIAKEFNTPFLYEDENLVAFSDIKPQAPHHILIIPKKHIPTINDLGENDEALLGKMILVGKKLAADLGVHESGYRLVFNCNEDGGQEVFHIHLHLLAGRPFHWPPG